MKQKLSRFTGGWFVGDFSPSVIQSKDVEVAVKFYEGGYSSKKANDLHHHKIATEITLVNNGIFKMDGETYVAGEFVVINPGHVLDFECIISGSITVVKSPSLPNDKYKENE